MQKYSGPSELRLAAHQPKAAEVVNLMVSGPGVPWEDRGSEGLFAAFFQSAVGMMFKPVQTLSKMRRPETANDARLFAAACGGIWFLAVGIQSAFAYYVFYAHDRTVDVDGQQYIINTILEAVLAGVAAALSPTVAAWMFYRLTAFDMTSKAPPVLVYNYMAYMMGPSLLALIPGGFVPWLPLGPALAGTWMFVLLLIVAIMRLRVRVAAAIIGSILTFLAMAGMVIGGIFLVQFLWTNLLNYASISEVPSKTTLQR